MASALRGINLGGWLIAERWMTPDLFEGVDEQGERAIGLGLGPEESAKRLKHHRDTFITEKDFAWIKHYGFDVVRLPVGYWLFEEDEGFISGEKYLQKAFEWAERHSIGVILDFHGLQGSQNGYDHSGQVGKVGLYRWGNRARALRTMEYLAKTYGKHPALIAIEIINEPKVRWFIWRLLRYYDKAFRVAQMYVRPDVKIIVSDAFKPIRMARALARRNYGGQLVLDVHLYQVFGSRDQLMTYEQHIEAVRIEWRKLLDDVSKHVPVMVGEWSAALPVSKTGIVQNKKIENLEYFKAQQNLFDEMSWSHSYWSYKAPNSGVWDYKSQQHFHS